MCKQLLFIFLGIVLTCVVEGNAQGVRSSINYDLTKTPPADQVINMAFTTSGLTSFKKEQDALFISVPLTIRIDNPSPFLTLNITGNFIDFDTSKLTLFVRFASTIEALGDFEAVHPYHHVDLSDSSFQSELLFLDPGETVFQFLILFKKLNPGETSTKATNLTFDFFSPGFSLPVNTPSNPLSNTLLGTDPDCDCSVPSHVSRTGWSAPPGQNYSSDPNKQPSYSSVSHLIVHHSAGPNSSNDWPATVLAIWNFHVNSNGWDDIGYNWVIDPNGQIYEGRGGGNDVVGAHFCGKNTGTMGICLLGTFENQAPTAKATAALSKLLAWKLCDANLDALDTTMLGNTGLDIPVISGHKEGCSTLCPGSVLFQDLPTVRQNALIAYNSCVTATNLDPLEQAQFKLFPNPSDGNAVLEWMQEAPSLGMIRILDQSGRRIFQQERFFAAGKMAIPLELNSLKDGIYWVQIHTGSSHLTEKLLVKK